MKYKMIVSDFDGTIYRSDYTISDNTKDAISKYVSKGGKMVIATGRLFSAIKPHAEKLDLKGEVITYQGSGVFDIESGDLMYQRDIPCELAAQVLEFMYNNDKYTCIPMMFYDDKCYVDKPSEFVTAFTNIVRVDATFAGVRLDEYILREGIIPRKILALVVPKEAQEFIAMLRENFGALFNINQSGPPLVEMVNIEASKGNAVAWLAEKYGIAREEIICIGDAENDNSMLQFAGLGVAVGNAMDITKAVADYITDTNDNDGVAKVIEKFGLED